MRAKRIIMLIVKALTRGAQPRRNKGLKPLRSGTTTPKSLFSQKTLRKISREIYDKLQSLTKEEYRYVMEQWKLSNNSGWARVVEKDYKKHLSLKLQLTELECKTPQSLKDSIREKFAIPEFWTNQPQGTN